MSAPNLEDEAGYYWRVASEARQIRRQDVGRPTIAQQDDLAAIVINSDWPKLKVAAQGAIAELNGAVASEEAQVCESSA